MIDLTLYNYILIKPNLSIEYCDVCSDKTTTSYASDVAIVSAISQVKSDYSYLGGIIPTINNQEYVVNVAKVQYYEQQLSFLYLRFANNYELRIDCSTNALALDSYNVIDCIYKSLNELIIYTNRKQWYVKEGIIDNPTLNSFSDIQTAIDYLELYGLTENAQIVVRAGTYDSFVSSGSLLIKFESDVTINGGTVIQSMSNTKKTNTVFMVQNSEDPDYYSPAIYVNNDLLLYGKMIDRAITFYYSGRTEAYSFLSLDTYLTAYESYIEDAHRDIATIGSSDGYVYFICMALVSGHSDLGDTLTINYSTGDNLIINCISGDDATFNNNYVGKHYTSYNIQAYLDSKRLLYVNPSYPAETATHFQTISSALGSATSGDLIYIENATHTASNLIMKNHIDFYCDGATINCSTGNLFIDASAVNVNIFGTAKITTTDIRSAKGLPVSLSFSSNVYFEFDTVNTVNAGTYSFSTILPSSLIVKGYSITSSNHAIDSDGKMNVYDVDVLHLIATGNCFYPIAQITTPVYFRNTKGVSIDPLGGIYLDSQMLGYIFNGINMRITDNSGHPYTITYGNLSDINLWNCFFQTTQDYSFDCDVDTQTVTCKNVAYSNKTYSNVIDISGNFTIKPYLNLN